MFEELKSYPAIAWDFDGVLDGHFLSDDFHKFIRENPFGQKHYIVTFRSHYMQYQIWPILASYPLRLNANDFVDMINIDDEIFENRQKSLATAYARLFTETQHDIDYICWKGKICNEHGIPVLIDDDPMNVLRGCKTYGIDYFHPDDLSV